VRYLKVGNQTATIIALCNLADFDLKANYCQVRHRVEEIITKSKYDK
jgi:hypothetical protein